ncbi:MAG: hypothetical protein HY079_14650 [Elusimicrobia bacterium]|nr:hypothetical protein [Elusimicrobiota bacterium]
MSAGERRTFYHPASGLAILGLDWLFFGLEWELGPVTEVLACLAAFAVCFFVVRRIQVRWHGDAPRVAAAKAAFGGLAAGVPFPIGGTLVGGLILLLSGLRASGLTSAARSLFSSPRR